MTENNRILMIAFDAGEPALMKRGIDDGWLPNIKSLVERGTYVRLRGHQDLLTSASWPTLATATEINEHLGLHDSMLVTGSYELRDVAASALERPPFWKFLCEAGVPATIVSIYAAQKLSDPACTQVIGWGSHDPFTAKAGHEHVFVPAELEHELRDLVGQRDVRNEMDLPVEPDDYVRTRDVLLHSIDQQERAIRFLLNRAPWRFFFATIPEVHLAGHIYWGMGTDAHHLGENVPEELRNALPRIYERADSAIGSIVEQVDDDVTVMLVSPYGIRPNTHLENSANMILERAKWLTRSAAPPSSKLRWMARGRRAVKAILPLRLRIRLGDMVPRRAWLGRLAYADVDWSKTKAFALPSDGSTYIRLNIDGREPNGSVDPDDRSSRLDELADLLRELHDLDTGNELLAAVARYEELVGAMPEGAMPDLCVSWKGQRRVRALRSDRLGEIELVSDDQRSGIHTKEGFLIGAGPGIPSSGAGELNGPEARLIDVGPTVLSRLGVDPAEHLPGKPIPTLAKG